MRVCNRGQRSKTPIDDSGDEVRPVERGQGGDECCHALKVVLGRADYAEAEEVLELKGRDHHGDSRGESSRHR